MSSFFNDIQQRNRQRESGTVLMIGAGQCLALPALRQLTPQQLILVEAHPQQAEELQYRIHPEAGEQVWSVGVVARPAQTVQLHQLNHLSESSLCLPGPGMTEHFPNIHPVGELTVAAKDLASVLRALDLDGAAHNVLILDVPGQVLPLLQETPIELLQNFPTIVVRAGVVPLYAGDADATEIQAVLYQLGFDASGEDDDTFYPHFQAWFNRNDDRIELRQLEKSMQAELIQLKDQLSVAVADYASLIVTRDELLVQCRQAGAEIATQQENIKAWQERLATQEVQHANVLSELRSQYELAIAQQEILRQAAAEWEQRFLQLDSKHGQALVEISELRSAVSGWEKRAAEHEQEQRLQSEAVVRYGQLLETCRERAASLEQAQTDLAQQRQSDQLAIQRLGDSLDAKAAALESSQANVASLQEQLTARAVELDVVRQAMKAETGDLQGQLESRAGLVETQQQELDALREQLKVAEQKRSELQQTLARQDDTRALREREIRQLQGERDALQTRVSQMEQELSEGKNALQQQQEHLLKQETNANEITHRQQRMHDELLKAEGQIDLIKDLLLHELGV